MKRRTFVKNAGIGAVAGTTIQGCATIGGMKHKDNNVDVSEFLNQLDREIAVLKRERTPLNNHLYLQERGLSPNFANDSLVAMLTLSSLRDLPKKVQQDDRIQMRYKKVLPKVGQLALRHMKYLKESSNEERKEIQQLLKNRPEVGADIRYQFLHGGSNLKVPDNRQNQLDEIMKETQWKLANQSPSLLIQGMQHQIERAAKKSGIAPEDWDELINFDLDSIDLSKYTEDDLKEESKKTKTKTKKSPAKKGGLLLLLGLLITGVSFLSGFATTSTSFAVISYIGTFVGLFLMGAGIFYLLVAIANTITEKNK